MPMRECITLRFGLGCQIIDSLFFRKIMQNDPQLGTLAKLTIV
jgi:hypothetical protein